MRQKFATNGMTPGHSQSSLKSTNPFDDEEDANNGSVKAPVRRYRKKRPAPPPPVQSKYVSSSTYKAGFCDYNNQLYSC